MKICWELHSTENNKYKLLTYKKPIEVIDFIEQGYGSVFIHCKKESIEEGQIYCADKIWFENETPRTSSFEIIKDTQTVVGRVVRL